MNKYSSLLVDNLMEKSSQKFYLKIIEKLFTTGIPFNSPHKFKFLEMSDNKTRLQLPLIKHNKNHLGGIHACATATLGELPAGLTLVKRFGSSKYRLILEELHADYIKQAKEDLVGEVQVEEEEFVRIESELEEHGVCEINLITNILNTKEEIIAVIQTKWHMKDWRDVRFKD